MPLLTPSYYDKPWWLFNGHLETIVPFLKEQVDRKLYSREQIKLDDGDHLDLDWIYNESEQLMILTHGIEGNSQSYYITNAARFFSKRNWDILAWNFRSCSKPLNNSPKLYHLGDTEDLSQVIQHALSKNQYKSIVLVGFSMGGSMVLKYLGEKKRNERINAAITYSVPCDFIDSLNQTEKLINRLYVQKILGKLKRKLRLKYSSERGLISAEEIDNLNSIRQFNEKVILPIYGFDGIEAYSKEASCNNYLPSIQIPTFIGNAWNDPMLGNRSYPVELARHQPYVHLEVPKSGGHLGFTTSHNRPNWMLSRTASFLEEHTMQIPPQRTKIGAKNAPSAF